MKTKEDILNKYIKGDLKTDYDKAARNYNTIYLQSALDALRDYEKELKKHLYTRKEVEGIIHKVLNDLSEENLCYEE